MPAFYDDRPYNRTMPDQQIDGQEQPTDGPGPGATSQGRPGRSDDDQGAQRPSDEHPDPSAGAGDTNERADQAARTSDPA